MIIRRLSNLASTAHARPLRVDVPNLRCSRISRSQQTLYLPASLSALGGGHRSREILNAARG
jgi:hypothetical protein